MYAQSYSRARLRVVADSDPGVIARILERFQNLNALPRRVHAELGSNDLLHIAIDVFGLDAAQRKFIVTKVAQAVCVVTAYWHEL